MQFDKALRTGNNPGKDASMEDELYYQAVLQEISERNYDFRPNPGKNYHIGTDDFLCLFPSPKNEDEAIFRIETSAETNFSMINPNNIDINLRTVLIANGRYLFRNKVAPLLKAKKSTKPSKAKCGIIHIVK